MEPTQVNPPVKGRKWFWLSLLSVVILVALAVVVPLWLVSSEPSYWRPVDANDPAVARVADEVESRVTSQATLVRPNGQAWTIELTQEEANAWLAARLPLWLANQGVDREILDAVRHAVTNLAEQRVEFAAQFRVGDREQVVALAYSPRVTPGEPVRLDLEGMYVGRLRVPTESLLAQVAAQLGGDDQDLAEAARVIRSIELAIPLEDGRKVTVTDIQLRDGRAALTCRTEFRPSPRR